MTEPVHFKLRDSVWHSVGSYSYVPIDKVLKNSCSHEDIWDQILNQNNPETDSEFLTDYCDGEIFKQHVFFFTSLFKTDTNVWAPAFAMVHEIWGQAPIF